MDTIDIIIGLLNESGNSQKDLTDYLGVTEAVFSQWKSKNSKSYEKHINKIADYFNVSTDYLLGKTDAKKAPSISLDEAEKLYELYQNADEKTKKMVEFLLGME